MALDLIIRGGTCVSHRGISKTDIAIRDGIIVAIGDLNNVTAEDEIDAAGLHILPGVIDTEFYLRAGFDQEPRAAFMGGVTSILSVNPNFAQDDGIKHYCNHASFVTANKTNLDAIEELEKNDGCAGVYLNISGLSGNDAIVDDRNILSLFKAVKRRVFVHAEDHLQLNDHQYLKLPGDLSSHSNWHSEKALVDGLRRVLAIARGAGKNVHIGHLSSTKEMAMIAAYKDIATAGITPYHLLLSEPDCYDHFHNFAKLNPPLRSEENRLGLWKGVSNGIVDTVASAHLPVMAQDKERPYPSCPSGAPAAQTMIPLLLDQVAKGSLTLQELVDMTSAGPARVFNIANKGRIAAGYDADFTVVDLDRNWVYEDEMVESACGWDFHAGAEFTGQVIGSIIHGSKVMWDGKIIGEPSGRMIRFNDNFTAYPDAH